MRKISLKSVAVDDSIPRLERKIILLSITNTDFVKDIKDFYSEGIFDYNNFNIIMEWVIEYYNNFHQAPNKQIYEIFSSKRDFLEDDETIETLLVSLNDELIEDPNINIEYYLQEAELYFRKRKIELLENDLKIARAGNRIEDAENLIANFTRTTREQTTGIDIIRDKKEIISAFDLHQSEYLFTMKGDLGKTIGDLERGYFVIVVAPMGVGKTWMLQEMGLKALFSGLNVLFISLEMTQRQMLRRLHTRLTGLPLDKYQGILYLPVLDCIHNQTGKCRNSISPKSLLINGIKTTPDKTPSGYIPCVKCRGQEDFSPDVWYNRVNSEAINTEDILRKAHSIENTILRGGKFKLVVPQMRGFSINKLTNIINNYEYYEGWIPDVIITDYLDKLTTDDKTIREYRHRIYDITLAHKALALDRKILVVSASQSNTGRDLSKRVDAGGFSEDIRKKAEIDIGFSISQTPEDKKKGVSFISPMKSRHDDFDSLNSCMILQHLKTGQFILDSCFVKEP